MTTLSLHGATTLLYAAPVPTELLSQLPLDNLAAYVATMAADLAAGDRERLEQGLAAAVERGGPWFERDRYELARTLARAVQVEPDAARSS
ncbi:hypothetical protein [Saccharopolyspora spinosa]|uniref:Uncharacterized protein n=1 Tax=Saccharopolyspora spinosa TaxID=60894 RepID=A0A2N3XT45_SACSN|nr:hypothetical protein [Saccharopolyspora spinosa]PKW13825.1 hypothetical protein A8926_1389 [Saccharopolyspora spinosa]